MREGTDMEILRDVLCIIVAVGAALVIGHIAVMILETALHGFGFF